MWIVKNRYIYIYIYMSANNYNAFTVSATGIRTQLLNNNKHTVKIQFNY